MEQDEEIASIETDKIDVSVNAPEAGVITEHLVSEGDTVTVDQPIAKIDAGASGGGEKKGGQEAKSPASDDQPTSSDPEPKAEQTEPPKEESKETPPPAKTEDKAPSPPPKQEKPAPPKEDGGKGEKKTERPTTSGVESPFGAGTRNENKVRSLVSSTDSFAKAGTGQDESHASEDSRALKAIAKYSCIPDHVQRSRYVQRDGVSEIV